jgi:anti-sigma B factor antagonist
MGYHEGNDSPTIDADADALLHITTHRLPTAVVIGAVGEVDLATAEHLTTAVQAEFDGPEGIVVIDVSAVTFLSSVGIAVLINAQRTAERSRRSLRIVVGDSRPVIRAIAAAGLDGHLPVFHRLDEALAAT